MVRVSERRRFPVIGGNHGQEGLFGLGSDGNREFSLGHHEIGPETYEFGDGFGSGGDIGPEFHENRFGHGFGLGNREFRSGLLEVGLENCVLEHGTREIHDLEIGYHDFSLGYGDICDFRPGFCNLELGSCVSGEKKTKFGKIEAGLGDSGKGSTNCGMILIGPHVSDTIMVDSGEIVAGFCKSSVIWEDSQGVGAGLCKSTEIGPNFGLIRARLCHSSKIGTIFKEMWAGYGKIGVFGVGIDAPKPNFSRFDSFEFIAQSSTNTDFVLVVHEAATTPSYVPAEFDSPRYLVPLCVLTFDFLEIGRRWSHSIAVS